MTNNLAKKVAPEYRIIRPDDHEGWLAERRLGIGASEAAAVLGVDNYTTPYQLWRRKIGIDPPVEQNFAMEMGHAMEYWVAKCFEESEGIQIIKASEGDWLAVDKARPYLRVSPDRLYWIPGEKHNQQNRGICECKTSQNVDHDPECLHKECMNYFCQLQYQLHVMRLSQGYLAFMCLKNGHRWFEQVQYNADFCNNTLIPAIDEMWNRHILPAQQFLSAHHITDPASMSPEYIDAIHEFAPSISTADDATTRYPHQQDGKSIQCSEVKIINPADSIYSLLTEYSNNRAQLKEIDPRQKQIEDTIKVVMGDIESIIGDDGKPVVTWKQNKSSSKFDDKAFRSENPELYARYLHDKPGPRVFKIK